VLEGFGSKSRLRAFDWCVSGLRSGSCERDVVCAFIDVVPNGLLNSVQPEERRLPVKERQ
jgi:hypothetical protein